MPQSNTINIVSFDIPYPPKYGGIIDVFYKIRALQNAGIKVILHAYRYGRSKPDPKLEEICEKVHYYKRQKNPISLLSPKPFIVKTRDSAHLLKNLNTNSYPILFEGLHTTYFLNHNSLKKRKKFVRTHNIEHEYYYKLSITEPEFFKKNYFRIESGKLQKYQKILEYADYILPISLSDFEYFSNNFKNVTYLPAFHPFENIDIPKGRGEHILYHGNLSVRENINAVLFLVKKVFKFTDKKIIIAGADPHKEIYRATADIPGIRISANPSELEMNELIKKAHIILIPTFQSTGLKLKLLSSLFAGRFCLTNSYMIENTGLEGLCSVKDTAEKILDEINNLFLREIDEHIIEKRREILLKLYSNQNNIEKLTRLI